MAWVWYHHHHPVKIQIMGRKVCLMCQGKTLLGIANKLFKTKSFVDITQQCFALLPQVKFPPNNLNFHWRRGWWDWIQAIFLDFRYFRWSRDLFGRRSEKFGNTNTNKVWPIKLPANVSIHQNYIWPLFKEIWNVWAECGSKYASAIIKNLGLELPTNFLLSIRGMEF